MSSNLNELSIKLKNYPIDLENDKIRKIDLYYCVNYLRGMILYDSDDYELAKLGAINASVKTIYIEEKEKIIGFRYEFNPNNLD